VGPEPAKKFYDSFCDRVRRDYVADKVQEGEFGAYMEVSIVRRSTMSCVKVTAANVGV
jgi:D-Tyr-tRNAtyr deacylase